MENFHTKKQQEPVVITNFSLKGFSDGAPYCPLPILDAIPLEQYKRIKEDKLFKPLAIRFHNNIKTPANIAHLGTHTRCICTETGISFAVSLPSPLHTTMTLLHPFAFYANVQTFIKDYQRKGIPINGLDNQVIAGMLITVLKHKGFGIARDYVKANLRLREINKRTLTWCLAFFRRCEGRYNQPQMNLEAQGNPTTQLLQFVQILKGEDDTVQALHIIEDKQKRVKAKVYQTKEDEEAAKLKNDIHVLLNFLERIQKSNPVWSLNDTLFTSFEQRIRKLAIYNDNAKEQLIADIMGSFGENENTKGMEVIIRANDMTELQKGIFSFSMELERDLEEFKGKQVGDSKKPIKIDFDILMGRKKPNE